MALLPVKWRTVIGYKKHFQRSIISHNGPAVHYVKTNACILKQNSKTNREFENYNFVCY
jgi:hypothetical protein